MKTVQFREKLRWADTLQGLSLTSACVAADGSAVLMALPETAKEKPFERHVAESGASFAARKIGEPYSAILINIGDGDYTSKIKIETTYAFPKIERLPDGRILVVGARCQIDAFDRGEPNASIYSVGGDVDASFCLGDGIEHICVTKEGKIWIGYFDEGVFGDFEAAQSGLACFNDKGENIWRFTPPPGLDSPADCYALAANENAVWACYYTNFPVVQISSDFKIKSWENTVVGAHHITVTNDNCLLFSGYKEDWDKCTIQTFDENELKDPVEFRLALPADQDLSKASISARDGRIYAMNEQAWYELWLDEILNA